MKITTNKSTHYRKMQMAGSALIFSLLILLVTSILVTSMIGESILELKMASNMELGISTFQMGDSGINSIVNNAIYNNSPERSLLSIENTDKPCKTVKAIVSRNSVNKSTSADVSVCKKGATHAIGSSLGRFINYAFEIKSSGKILKTNISNNVSNNISNNIVQGVSSGPYSVTRRTWN